MTIRSLLLVPALAATAMLGAPAGADTLVHTLPTVVLHGKAQLEAACPNAGALMQTALEGVVRHLQLDGTMKVSFKLAGQQVSEVEIQGGPRRYYSHVRTALGDLSCSASTNMAEMHSFQINFSTS